MKKNRDRANSKIVRQMREQRKRKQQLAEAETGK